MKLKYFVYKLLRGGAGMYLRDTNYVNVARRTQEVRALFADPMERPTATSAS